MQVTFSYHKAISENRSRFHDWMEAAHLNFNCTLKDNVFLHLDIIFEYNSYVSILIAWSDCHECIDRGVLLGHTSVDGTSSTSYGDNR